MLTEKAYVFYFESFILNFSMFLCDFNHGPSEEKFLEVIQYYVRRTLWTAFTDKYIKP